MARARAAGAGLAALAGLLGLVAAATAACGGSPPVATPDPPGAAATPPETTDGRAEAALAGATPSTVVFTFDRARPLAVDRGLRQVASGGAQVRFVPSPTGLAAQFPPRCRVRKCPRAILEHNNPAAFNSGLRPIRFGASVLMTRADTAPGANVVQKGYSTNGGSQFKLQVDGGAGRPSCVLANGRAIYRLVAPVTVADGRWHHLACLRSGGQLLMTVDGSTWRRPIPASLALRNNQPLRIGGKNALAGNDQFAGRVDNVFVTLY
ncbi:LamG-like jellyroll fold domain-containing protein [Pilimelia columellifera]|uniref:LamG-like jellyroll fold domain-containing protein n=1 Tax=Pilimelia columellifera TaxID=706574 RepID=UPI0031D462D4